MIIFISLVVITCIITSCIIASKWNYYAKNYFELTILRSLNTLARIWPTEDKFFSLHWVVIRWFVFGIGGVLVHMLIGSSVISMIYNTILFAMIILSWFTEKGRKMELMDRPVEVRGTLIPVKAACTAALWMRIIIYLIQVGAYAFRP